MPKCAARLLLVTGLAGLLCACDYIGMSRPPWLISSPPPQHRYYPSYSYSYRRSRERARSPRRWASRESSAPVADAERPPAIYGASEHPASAPAVTEKPPVTLSMAGDSSDRARAQRLLEQTDKTLVQARAHRLTGAEKDTWERASQLATRARHALAENDCAAASSLAGKALSLAADIGGK